MKKAAVQKKKFLATCVARVETIHGTYYRFEASGKPFKTYLTNRSDRQVVIGERYRIAADGDSKVLLCDIMSA
jgi:hypothetical protein